MITQRNFKLMMLSASMLMLSPMAGASEGATFCYGPECELPPEKWSEEFHECGGSAQSPIDISDAADNDSLPAIEFHYTDNALAVLNNGHTTEVEVEEGKNHIMVGGEKCELLQFHFHTESEHTVNEMHSAMEAHLVHLCESGRNAVVGVLLEEKGGKGNAALGAALDHSPYDRKTHSYVVGEVEIEDKTVNPGDLLPSDTSYYRYDGSLTTPGCSEVVDWYVLTNPMHTSKKQVKTFEGILEDPSPDEFDNNNRPVQDLNGRPVEKSAE